MSIYAGHRSPPPPLWSLALSCALGCGLTACGDDDPSAPPPAGPAVMISGAHSIPVGQTLALGASTVNGTDTGYTWSSSDEAVATVDASGAVLGVAPGEADISAVGATSGARGTHPVVVLGAASGAARVTISGRLTLVPTGTSALTATTLNGSDASYVWSSSAPTTATVSAAGVVTALDIGTADITAVGAETGAAATVAVVVSADVPFFAMWAGSGHADRESDAFRHWDEDGEISASCAKCHSSLGYRDFLGADGTAAGAVDGPSPLGTVVDCQVCHNPAAIALDSVTFPSGVTVNDAEAEARCMTCHQGRGSTDDVRAAIATAGVTDDQLSMDLSFINQHFYAAGATVLAGQVRGAYQYDNRVYDWRFRHVESYDQCQECHDPHTLEVQVSACASCHSGVSSVADIRDIRMVASAGQDYDGDGDRSEGLRAEIVGPMSLSSKLLTAIQRYASEQPDLANICYGDGYPYFFVDSDGDGSCSATEGRFPNRYVTWTPRLLKAAYNYQVAQKDPGAYAHNAKYIIQALFDSITDLNSALTNPVDMSAAVRNDRGHFNGAGAASRYWDEDATVSSRCSQCHGGEQGFDFYLQYGVGRDVPEQANGLECELCHTDLSQGPQLVTVEEVTLPSGARITTLFDSDTVGRSSSNLCGVCHMGRSSGRDVAAAVGATASTQVLPQQGFINPHYKPAYASKVGAQGQLGFHYAGRTYAGAFTGHVIGDECAACHRPGNNDHSFDVQQIAAEMECRVCHPGADQDIQAINGALGRERGVDYDGDGATEQLAAELEGMAQRVYDQLQTVTRSQANTDTICYADAYPYFFSDTDDSGGSCDASEANFGNQYRGNFTPQTLQAAYNWQVWHVEQGAWAHNFDYVGQLLYDAFVDLGGSPTAMSRP